MSRSNPCEPIDEPCTRRTVPLAGCVTERFSAMNSFLPFDVVQCSWLGCRVVVTVLINLPPLLAANVRGGVSFNRHFAAYRSGVPLRNAEMSSIMQAISLTRTSRVILAEWG